MKSVKLLEDNYYHIYCRGNNKDPIFFIEKDYYRLLLTILLFQSTIPITNIARLVDNFYKDGFESISNNLLEDIVENRIVELMTFIFMPNHFHLVLRQVREDGIVDYMKRVLDGYTKYINIRHKHSGHVFQGRFGRVSVDDNNQLLYLSSYIHLNCRELSGWRGKENKYLWSSYRDYLSGNNWKGLLVPNIIINQFNSNREFQKFTQFSAAKTKIELSEELTHPSFRK